MAQIKTLSKNEKIMELSIIKFLKKKMCKLYWKILKKQENY